MSDLSRFVDVADDHVAVRDGKGAIRIKIKPQAKGPAAILYNPRGQIVGGLSFHRDGTLVVTLTDANANSRAGLMLHETRPYIALFDADGEITKGFAFDDEGIVLVNVDDEGNPIGVRPALDPPPKITDLFDSQN